MISFRIYRYQLLPNDRTFQGSIFDGRSVEDIIANKNKLFWEAKDEIDIFHSNRSKSITKKIFDSKDIAIFRSGVERKLKRATEDFKKEILDTWPDSLVILWNDPEQQMIAIQHNPQAFGSTDTLLRTIVRNTNKFLNIYQLSMYAYPIYNQSEFWHYIESHKGKIEAIEFSFLTPNMSSISKAITEDLKEFAKSTNSAKNKLEIRAHENSTLIVEKDNQQAAGLVSYSSAGGGEIRVKIRGLRKKVTIGDNTRETEIDKLEIESEDHEKIIDAVTALLNG